MTTPPPAPQSALRLNQQICFPLYAASRLVTRLYQPLLEPFGLTYPQYIVLMILWEDGPSAIGHIGARALLNTNTLTPLLKRLEQTGLIERKRRQDDERVVEIALTGAGKAMEERCACVPERLVARSHFPADKALALKALLDEMVETLSSTGLTETVE